MLTLEAAIEIAEKERGSKVVEARDCGDRFAFAFEIDYPKQTVAFDERIPDFAKSVLAGIQTLHMFVSKIDGGIEYFYIAQPQYTDMFQKGTQINLSKERVGRERRDTSAVAPALSLCHKLP